MGCSCKFSLKPINWVLFNLLDSYRRVIICFVLFIMTPISTGCRGHWGGTSGSNLAPRYLGVAAKQKTTDVCSQEFNPLQNISERHKAHSFLEKKDEKSQSCTNKKFAFMFGSLTWWMNCTIFQSFRRRLLFSGTSGAGLGFRWPARAHCSKWRRTVLAAWFVLHLQTISTAWFV